jgi:hypothetical protein
MESKKPHAKIGYLSENLGKRLSIDENLPNGELYTILTSKAASRKGNHSGNDCWN